MKVLKTAVAGTMESSDIMVTVAPPEGNLIEIELNSLVEKQFGDQIRESILEILQKHDITSAKINAIDKGALDCTIKARVETAIYRACEVTDYIWKE